jgi:hypothetical protein
MLSRVNALVCSPLISSRAIFPSAFPALAAGFLAPVVGRTRTANFYGIGVILPAIASLAITLFRNRRA